MADQDSGEHIWDMNNDVFYPAWEGGAYNPILDEFYENNPPSGGGPGEGYEGPPTDWGWGS